MKAKTRFTVNIVWLTLAMIGGLSLALIMGVMMGVDKDIDIQRMLLLVLGVVITIWSFIYLLKVNRKEEGRRINEVVEEHHEFITHWVIPPEQWHSFIEQRLLWEKKEAKGYGFTLAIILGLVAVLIAYRNLPLANAALVTLLVFSLGFLIGFFGARKGANHRFQRDARFEQGEAYFARHLIVLNGQLIQIKDFAVSLLDVKSEELFGMSLLTLKIQNGLGNRKSVKLYRIPIPIDHKQEAERLLDLYAGLI